MTYHLMLGKDTSGSKIVYQKKEINSLHLVVTELVMVTGILQC